MHELLHDAVGMAVSGVSTVAILQLPDGTRRTALKGGASTPVWEAELVMEAPTARRAVLAVPTQDTLHIVAVDLDCGIDVYRCLLVHHGDDVSAGPVERFTGQIQLHPQAPGFVLVQAMRAYSGEEDGEDAAA